MHKKMVLTKLRESWGNLVKKTLSSWWFCDSALSNNFIFSGLYWRFKKITQLLIKTRCFKWQEMLKKAINQMELLLIIKPEKKKKRGFETGNRTWISTL